MCWQMFLRKHKNNTQAYANDQQCNVHHVVFNTDDVQAYTQACVQAYSNNNSHALANVHEQHNDNTQAYANDNITIILMRWPIHKHINMIILQLLLMRWPIRLQKHKHQQCKCS
jgi:hypothetical protein